MNPACASQTQGEAFEPRLAALASGLTTLLDKPEETATATLRALWALTAGSAVSAELAVEQPLAELDEAALARLDALLARRLAGEPLAHLTGRQHFMGMELLAGPEALIPRRETEILANAALGKLRQLIVEQGGRPATVIDVCTGCGNLALALACHEPRSRVLASDLSPEAIELAGRNVEHLGLAGRVELRCGDFLEPLNEEAIRGHVDLLVCNPPYISSGKLKGMPEEIIAREPSLAFDGGPFGIRILQRLMREAPVYLRPGGWLAFEVGLGQGSAALQWLGKMTEFDQTEHALDAEGQVRAVLARRAPT
jgi:release factor glutamine methyltransferase